MAGAKTWGNDKKHQSWVARTVREERARVGWSAETLAERLGCDRSTVVRLEKGDTPVTLGLAELLAEAFRIPVFAFIHSLVPPDVEPDIAQLERWAHGELKRGFGETMRRETVREVAWLAGDLPDHELEAVLTASLRPLHHARHGAASDVNIPMTFGYPAIKETDPISEESDR